MSLLTRFLLRTLGAQTHPDSQLDALTVHYLQQGRIRCYDIHLTQRSTGNMAKKEPVSTVASTSRQLSPSMLEIRIG